MDEYSGKRAVDGIVVSRKGSGLVLRDNANNRDPNAQFCNRLGCSGKLNSRGSQNGCSEKAKSLRPSLRSSSSGKEIIGSSSRTCLTIDLSVLPLVEESDHLNSHSNIDHVKGTSPSRTNNVLKGLRAAMSEEELKIRSELEMEIERDLEEEIKDGIYRHALRLHRLYQQQKERIAKEGPGFETFQAGQQRKNNQTLLEVNISIRMEGGTKIEIKETKKEAHDHHQEKGRPRTSRSENMQPFLPVSNWKKLDWVRSLRFNAGRPVALDRSSSKHGSLHQPKTPISNNRCCYDLNLDLKNARRIFTTSALGQPKVRASVDHKVLELGWKN